jgi:hypothetical protein
MNSVERIDNPHDRYVDLEFQQLQITSSTLNSDEYSIIYGSKYAHKQQEFVLGFNN